MKDFFDSAMALIDRSWHLATGFAIGCAAIVVGNSLGFWPLNKLTEELVAFAAVGACLGIGVVLGHIIKTLIVGISTWRGGRKAAAAIFQRDAEAILHLENLTSAEHDLVAWLMLKDFSGIEANRLQEPLPSLVRKRILLGTDPNPRAAHQMFKFSPMVWSARDGFLVNLDESEKRRLERLSDAPLVIKRHGWMG